jgi:uncharacterized protein YjbJ (UPF0337 family)
MVQEHQITGSLRRNRVAPSLFNMRAFAPPRRDAWTKERQVMDRDRVEGMAKQVKGSVKEAIGKVTGDGKTEAEGKAEKAAGKVQNTVGGAKDGVRDALDK